MKHTNNSQPKRAGPEFRPTGASTQRWSARCLLRQQATSLRQPSQQRRNDGALQIATDGRDVATRRILLATGVVNHWPPLATKDHDLGLSRGLIRYCPICDAYEVRDKRIAVLGSGEHGVAEALSGNRPTALPVRRLRCADCP